MSKRHGSTHTARGAGRGVICCLAICLSLVATVCHAQDGTKRVAHLYFADAQHPFLIAETRVMPISRDPAALGRRLIGALIDGSSEGNRATIPKGTQLRAFFLLDDGMAVVDFSPQLRENHPGGCRMEQLTLFSVVNSLVLNIPEIRQVKILIDGAEAQTLAGHLCLAFPLTADMLLTR